MCLLSGFSGCEFLVGGAVAGVVVEVDWGRCKDVAVEVTEFEKR